MTFQILNLAQGSDAWRKHRSIALNASDAPAMMGCSSYKTRSELVRERATGIVPEVDAATQRRFDDGHRFEALARPLAEQIISEELSPCVGANGKYSASFDGLSFVGDMALEHKTLNERLRAAMQEGCAGTDLPLEYQVQMEHQAMVAETIERILFMASTWRVDDDGEWVLEEERHCWYTPRPDLRARIVAGWNQFEQDVAAYVPTEPAAPVTATPVESLPAVVVQVQGALTVGGNLDAFGRALRAFIERIPQRPETDQQFADAEAACKALKKAEDALTQAEDGALAQISDVELMRRTVADLKALARTTRLATEKLVKTEKDTRRAERVLAARSEFDKHVARLQVDIKGVRLIVPMPDFGGAIKGLSSLASIDDKLTAALIAGQAEANITASRIINNLQTLDSVPQYAHLFADRQELAYKDAETLELLMQKRVDAEAARIEAERESIRLEEERKAQAAAEAKAEAERQRIRAEEQYKAQMEAAESMKAEQAEREAEAKRQTILSEAAKPAVTRALEMIEREKDVAPGKPLAPAPTYAAPVDDEPAILKLGDINGRLQHLSLSAEDMRAFGIEPAARDKRAVLYTEAQFRALLTAISAHVSALARQYRVGMISAEAAA